MSENHNMDDSTTIETLKRMAVAFRDERDWKKFHKPKDLAMGMSIEAGELLELFLWKSEEEIARMLQSPEQIERLRHEIADVFIYLMYLGHECDIDISKAVRDKIEHNAKKYPAHKSRGKSAKYTEL